MKASGILAAYDDPFTRAPVQNVAPWFSTYALEHFPIQLDQKNALEQDAFNLNRIQL